MQRYKRQILDKEKGILASLQKTKQDMEDEIAGLEQFLLQRLDELNQRQKTGISAAELSGYRFFQENIQKQIADLNKRLQELQVQVDAQIEIVMKASQELKSIDKLEEKQREEYQQEVARAESEEIAEFITMKM